jgi:hypothetical protein
VLALKRRDRPHLLDMVVKETGDLRAGEVIDHDIHPIRFLLVRKPIAPNPKIAGAVSAVGSRFTKSKVEGLRHAQK